MKVCLVTMWADNYRGVAEITTPVMREYCAKHDYQFCEIKLEDGDKYHYKKHEYFNEIFPYFDVILYMDVDCLITNHTVKVESILDDYNDFYITKDWLELNGGVMILKVFSWLRCFNNAVLASRGVYPNEQNFYNAIWNLWGHFKDYYRPRMRVCKQSLFNSYLYKELYPECGEQQEGQWQRGHFILHVPGCAIEKRIEVLKEYSNYIVR